MPPALTRRSLLAAAGAALLLLALSNGSEAETRQATKGATVLTIAGDIARDNRGAVDPKLDGVFRYHEIEFDRAFALDRAMLEALPQVSFEAQLPEGHEKATFSGPRLSAVLRLAGAPENASLAARALDGYVTDLAAEDVSGRDWIVVLNRNGKPFGIGGFGPVMLMEKPRGVKVEEGSPWPWAVFYLEVKN